MDFCWREQKSHFSLKAPSLIIQTGINDVMTTFQTFQKITGYFY